MRVIASPYLQIIVSLTDRNQRKLYRSVDSYCRKNLYKLEAEIDKSRIMAFFGQVRSRLVVLLYDKHERLVPDIKLWWITECDINKDISK